MPLDQGIDELSGPNRNSSPYYVWVIHADELICICKWLILSAVQINSNPLSRHDNTWFMTIFITLGIYSKAATSPTFPPPGVLNHVVITLVLELQFTNELEKMIHTSLYCRRPQYIRLAASQVCTEYFAKKIYFHYINSIYCLIWHKYVNQYYFSTNNLCDGYFSTTCVNFIVTNRVQL